MIDHGKQNLLGIQVDALDYEAALERILRAADERRGLAVSALAVHGVITGVTDRAHKYRLNHCDLVVPDGQPVAWALGALHGLRLPGRVHGPTLSEHLCAAAAKRGTPIYLYGSRADVIAEMSARLIQRYPGIAIVGAEPSQFRRLSAPEFDALMARIQASGARLLLVGLGCPRQEVFVYECRAALDMPALAVGAAFDYFAGRLQLAPWWMQRAGLEWLYRFAQEPRRLWRRYTFTNAAFVALFFAQWTHLWRPDPMRCDAPSEGMRYG